MRRERLDIMNDILLLCHSPTKKGQILYKCNLRYKQFAKYTDFLVSNHFLDPISKNGEDFLQVTKKGKDLIKDYESLKNFLNNTSAS